MQPMHPMPKQLSDGKVHGSDGDIELILLNDKVACKATRL